MVHYIWLDYKSSTGSESSNLVFNGKMSDKQAIRDIDYNIEDRLEELIKATPRWMKDVIEIRLSAQNIITSEVIYRREIKLIQ